MSIPNGLVQYLTGIQHVSCVVVGVTRNAAGVFTADATSYDLLALAVFDELDHRRTKQSVDIRPTNAPVANNVPIAQDFEMTLSEIMQPGIISRLKVISQTFDYAQVTFKVSPDGGTTLNTYETITGMIDSTSVRYNTEKHTYQMTLRACGVAQY